MRYIYFSLLAVSIAANISCTTSTPINKGSGAPIAANYSEHSYSNQLEASPTILDRGKQIEYIAAKSSCATHYFKNRGQPPIGYINGMALMYAKSYCELKGVDKTAASIMSQPLGSAKYDALVHYARNDTTPIGRLRAVYALSIGEGMRESSGNTTEGRDESVPENKATPSNAEAGLFQVSYDSFSAVKKVAPESEMWLRALYKKYQMPGAECELETFMKGVHDKKKKIIGSGDEARFQDLAKSCPAFSAEYIQVMLRSYLPHFGPVKRKEAELFEGCEQLLSEVEVVANSMCP